jgi:hypothetical protein
MFSLTKRANPHPQKTFDRKAFREEMMEMNPTQAADVATKWAERAVNATEEMEQTYDTMGKLGSGGLFAFLIGLHNGRQKAQAEHLISEWEAGGATEAEASLEEYPTPWSTPDKVERDPTKFIFIPWAWFWTGLAAIIGAFDYNGNEYVREAAKAGFFVILADLGSSAGHNMRQKKLKAQSEEAAEEAA